jgi:DNA-binding CsgD family transcriptional regulator
MNEKQLVAEISDMTEMARSASSIDVYDRFILERLQRLVGYDVAFLVRGGGPNHVTFGFDEPIRRACADRWPIFARELDVFARDALAHRGAGIDLVFFGSSELAKKTYYRDIMQPLRGRSTLIGYLSRRGQVEAKLALGRKQGTPDFTDAELTTLEALLPTLTLCEFAVRPSRPESSDLALATLTPREREVMDYLTLGYTNAEIALACGTSPATVRNQLSSVFHKLGASTRAEAVALALKPRLP